MRYFILALVLPFILLAVLADLRAQAPGAPPATATELDHLRDENVRLQAIIVGKDRELANLRYSLGKQIVELRADLEEAQLNLRANVLLPVLRERFHPPNDDVFDWGRGLFVTPKPQEPKP